MINHFLITGKVDLDVKTNDNQTPCLSASLPRARLTLIIMGAAVDGVRESHAEAESYMVRVIQGLGSINTVLQGIYVALHANYENSHCLFPAPA